MLSPQDSETRDRSPHY